jgi:predicted transport protein
MDLVNFRKISLKNHPGLNEKFVQEEIAKNPQILGLGELILKDKERIQPRAGRLDLLLQEPESNRRYEVEVQLGKTDESHIIRTIEYWDIERKRYPQYEHCAVIVAEDITSRFLNVIQLFNGCIPIIAIQMNAYEAENKLGLIFTKVIDELKFGFIEEDEEITDITDRNYWENKGSKKTVQLVDKLLIFIKEIDLSFEIKYNKHYIGLTKNGNPYNFASFRAKKTNLRMEIRLEQSDDVETELHESDLDLMDYDRRYGRYRIRLTEEDMQNNEEILKKLLRRSYEYFSS